MLHVNTRVLFSQNRLYLFYTNHIETPRSVLFASNLNRGKMAIAAQPAAPGRPHFGNETRRVVQVTHRPRGYRSHGGMLRHHTTFNSTLLTALLHFSSWHLPIRRLRRQSRSLLLYKI